MYVQARLQAGLSAQRQIACLWALITCLTVTIALIDSFYVFFSEIQDSVGFCDCMCKMVDCICQQFRLKIWKFEI